MERSILIERPFKSDINRIYLPGDTDTLANPVLVAMMESPHCEVAFYNRSKHNPGICFTITSTSGVEQPTDPTTATSVASEVKDPKVPAPSIAATTIFREALEKCYLRSEEAIADFKREYAEYAERNEIPGGRSTLF